MFVGGLFKGSALGAALFLKVSDGGVSGLIKALRDDKELAPQPSSAAAIVAPGNTYGQNGKPKGGQIVGTLLSVTI